MWRNLLIDRFEFKAHVGSRENRVYELGLAKGGPKLKPARADEPPEPGFPSPRAGQKLGLSVVPPRNVRLTFRDYSMREFAEQLGWPLATVGDAGGMTVGSVLDRTELKVGVQFRLGIRRSVGSSGRPLKLYLSILQTNPRVKIRRSNCFGNPSATINTSSFGNVTTAAGNRNIQPGAKLQF